MATDAETIAQLQAERAELLRRIDAAVAEGRRAQRRDDAAPIGPPVWSHEEFTAAVAEEREACARVCDAEAAWQAKQGRTTEFVLRAVAREIRVRGTQEPRQRPEAPSDVAAPAPDTPSPAGAPPVAATKRCPACNGRGVRRYVREVEDGCDECEATGRVPAEGGE